MNSLKAFDAVFGTKSAVARELYVHFASVFSAVGEVQFIPAKTMIGVATDRKRVAYVTQAGRDFLHVVFPFETEYADNLCFQKIAKVPGQKQYNHHFRMRDKADVNAEVRRFMMLAILD